MQGINQLYSSNKFDSNIKNKKQNTETVSNTRRDKQTQTHTKGTRSSATAEKQRVRCACLPELAN